MNAAYEFLLWALLPFALLRLLWRSRRQPAYRRRLLERLGMGPRLSTRCIWLHAVSVGEVQASEQLVRRLQARCPDLPIVITTTTPTGAERVRTLFTDTVIHAYFPYDLSWFVRRFISRARPRMLILVETEIWPNVLRLCHAQNIPVILANGRMSARSATRYARFGAFRQQAFSRLAAVAAQSQADAERFVRLGVSRERVQVTGSVKFDMRLPASIQERAQAMRRIWGGSRPVWLAASTHEGEEEAILRAHRRLLERLPQALLVIVPRHPERFERVAHLITRHGLHHQRRSQPAHWNSDTQVFLVDSMGELPAFLGAVDVAFIGGSLVPVGGHNMLEASAQGVAVLFGPYVFNFSSIARLLLEANAACQIDSEKTLVQQLYRLLTDASTRTTLGENGRQVVARNQGAVERVLRMLQGFLECLKN